MENIEQPQQQSENPGSGDELVVEPDRGNVRTREDIEEEREDNLKTDAWREQK